MSEIKFRKMQEKKTFSSCVNKEEKRNQVIFLYLKLKLFRGGQRNQA